MAQKKTTMQEVYDNVLTAIEATRGSFVQTKSKNDVPLYWRVGRCIRGAIGGNPHTERSKKLLSSVSSKLGTSYGNEFSTSNLAKMVELSAQFSDYEMVTTLAKQLTWEHFQTLITIDDDIKRDFYAWMALAKGWKPKALASRIKTDYFEKTPAAEKTPADNDAAFSKTLTSHAQQLWSFLGLNNDK